MVFVFFQNAYFGSDFFQNKSLQLIDEACANEKNDNEIWGIKHWFDWIVIVPEADGINKR